MANVKYTLGAVRRVCDRIANGESVRAICREPRARGIPAWRSFFRWVKVYPEAKNIYEAACLIRTHTLLDEIIQIADGREGSSGSVKEDRLRIAARIWRVEGFRPTAERKAMRRKAPGAE